MVACAARAFLRARLAAPVAALDGIVVSGGGLDVVPRVWSCGVVAGSQISSSGV